MEDKSNKQIASAVVVTCGANNYLSSCLDSLRAQTVPALEIIVVDNSLSADSSRRIASFYPEIKLFAQKENIFYCSALNLGINASCGEFVLCLNDDIILEKAFIEKALEGFLIDARIGSASGKVLRMDRKTIDSAGLFLSCWRAAKERGYGSEDQGQFQRQEYVFGVNGASAFYRRAMLEDIKDENGFFDSDFRMFYEDLDVAWRAMRRGWKCLYLPACLAYHLRGGSSRAKSGINKPYARRYLSDSLHIDLIKNRYLAMIKNESPLGFLLHLPFVACYDLFIWAYILFFRPKLLILTFSNLKYFKSALRKRLRKNNPLPFL